MIKKLSDLIKQGRSRKAEASLAAAEPDALVLSVTERENDKRTVTRMMRVNGKWRVGAGNTLEFVLDKNESKKGVVLFGADWRVNKANEIEVTFGPDRAALKGVWDVADRNSLVYQIRRGSGEELRFRGAFQTRSIHAKKGEIRYQLGAEGSRKKTVRAVKLFGKWILSRDLGLSFEIEYANGKRRAILFGGDCRMDVDNTIRVDLVARKDKPLGVELVLTRELTDGSVFMRLSRSLNESLAEAGLSLSW